MRLFGLDITRRKAVTLSGVDNVGWRSMLNFWPGQTWQNDVVVNPATVTANWAVFSCMTLIAGDIGKVNLQLVKRQKSIWLPADSPAFGPVINKPNGFQTRQQFIEQWITSKLGAGNTYALKQRDNRGVVVALYILDPNRITPLVAPDGSVYYRLGEDDLSGLPNQIPAAPASEIIHDRMNCLFHPLVGLSPIYACGLAATQGLKIQQNSAKFFENMSRPSGVLTGPDEIKPETAERLKAAWDSNFGGDKIGKVAVLGDGLKYESMAVNAVDSQMLEQLKATAEMVCSTFHVPAFKIGAGTIPAGQKVEDLNQIYYADCLHALMDAIQTLLVYGLGLDTPKDGNEYSVRFDLDDLLKMDSATFALTTKALIDASVMAPNEGRTRFNLAPVSGGDAPLSQQQNYSLEALAKRDAKEDPFGSKAPMPAASPPTAPPPEPPPSAKHIAAELLALAPATIAREEIVAIVAANAPDFAAAIAPMRAEIAAIAAATAETACRIDEERAARAVQLDTDAQAAAEREAAQTRAREQTVEFLRAVQAGFADHV